MSYFVASLEYHVETLKYFVANVFVKVSEIKIRFKYYGSDTVYWEKQKWIGGNDLMSVKHELLYCKCDETLRYQESEIFEFVYHAQPLELKNRIKIGGNDEVSSKSQWLHCTSI